LGNSPKSPRVHAKKLRLGAIRAIDDTRLFFDCGPVLRAAIQYAMTLLFSVLILAFAGVTPQATPVVANASPSTFVGTWVGTQSWAIDNPSPSAKEEQPVELKIEMVGNQIVGFMNPWFGGSDGATFIQTAIDGDQLKATAIVGKPPAPGARGQRGNWKSNVRILFNLKSDFKDTLTGTADVMMNDVKWLKFNYNLSKKRSRY